MTLPLVAWSEYRRQVLHGINQCKLDRLVFQSSIPQITLDPSQKEAYLSGQFDAELLRAIIGYLEAKG